MAPTKCKLEKPNVGEEILDLVIPYIHDVEDRSSVSLVSRKFYEIDGITRKRLTVHTLYYPNPASLSKRFPFIESLTLKGRPSIFKFSSEHVIRIAPWIQQLALEFKFLKELHIRNLVVNDVDLETLARTRGKDLRSLKISRCYGYSIDGLRHVSKYCNQLRTLCLGHSYGIDVNNGIWLHELALNNAVLERLQVKFSDDSYTEYLTLLAKNCCNSLISLNIGEFYLSKLGDAFRYARRLERFGGYICDEESDLVGFQFPPNTRSLSIVDLPVTRYSTVIPFLNHIRKLKLGFHDLDPECQCLLFKQCPNLEVLYTSDVCGDQGLEVISKFCKKLRKLTHNGPVTHVGLIALAKGCTNLESLDVTFGKISNEALECVGTHLKNLRHLLIWVGSENNIIDLPLDNGIQAILMGCSKLEILHIRHLWHGGLTDVGLEYIGKYGSNLRSLGLQFVGKYDAGLMKLSDAGLVKFVLRSLTLECEGNSNTGLMKLSNAGLVKLSQGCPKLRKLELTNCGFSEQVATIFMFNIPSLRYVGNDDFPTGLALTRPEFEHRNIGRSKLKRTSPTSDEV